MSLLRRYNVLGAEDTGERRLSPSTVYPEVHKPKTVDIVGYQLGESI